MAAELSVGYSLNQILNDIDYVVTKVNIFFFSSLSSLIVSLFGYLVCIFNLSLTSFRAIVFQLYMNDIDSEHYSPWLLHSMFINIHLQRYSDHLFGDSVSFFQFWNFWSCLRIMLLLSSSSYALNNNVLIIYTDLLHMQVYKSTASS